LGLKEFFKDVHRASLDISEIYKDEPVGMFKWFTYGFWYCALTIAYGIAKLFKDKDDPDNKDNEKKEKNTEEDKKCKTTK
jgi:hypothetical protein